MILTPFQSRPRARRLLFGICLALIAAGCRSASEHVVDADREVYEIVSQRRDELAAGGAFTIDPIEETLRDRILSGEVALEPLDLARCLEVAAENSRGFQSRREALYLVALDLTLERWHFSIQETGTFGAFLSGRGDGPQSAGAVSNLGLARLIGTGLSIIGNVGIDLVRDVSRADGWDAVSNFTLNITQPLLRGFGRDVVMEPLTQADRDVLYEARGFERFRRTFAFDVAERYFRIIEEMDVLANEEQNHVRLVRLRERNEAFAEAGLLNDIQVDQARQDEVSAESRVIEARRSLESRLDELKLFFGLPVDVELVLDPVNRPRLDMWDALAVEFSEDDAVDVALRERLDFLNELDRREDSLRHVEVARDALSSGLDLNIDLAFVSKDGEPFRYDRSTYRGRIGLDLDAAIDRLPERNSYRRSLIAAQVATRRVDASADSIRAELRDSLRRQVASRENHRIQTGAVELAQRRVESAELNLEAGRASTRDVLDAQRDLLSAQNSAARSLTEYILSGLALYRDMELIRVSADGIEIEIEALSNRLESEENTPRDMP